MTKEKDFCNVTFLVTGEQFKAMEYMHKTFGITKTQQAEFIFKQVAANMDSYKKELLPALIGTASDAMHHYGQILDELNKKDYWEGK